MPISIAGGMHGMATAKRKPPLDPEGAKDLDDEAMYPGTFIPPHELSHKQDNYMSVAGAGASSLMKRDRLRNRTAIMKATGFLETATERRSIDRQSIDRLKFDQLAMAAGGLSQSFKSPVGSLKC